MLLSKAKLLAAQCWCEAETSDIVMDERLCLAVAKKLIEVSRNERDTAIERRIAKMNEVFQIGLNYQLIDLGSERITKFHKVIGDEVDELLEATTEEGTTDFVALADCLADIVVYCFSEAARWGIPLVGTFHLVMDSQDSKLVDGKPVMAPDGSKFIKGPNYQPPEDSIRELLELYKP